MARAAPPSRRPPPSAMAASAASAPPAVTAAAAAAAAKAGASLVPQRRATFQFQGAWSRPQPQHHRRLSLPVVAGGRLDDPRVAKRQPSCACSPTTHPGSFRCALHRGQGAAGVVRVPTAPAPAPVSSRLSAPRRASMANPLVRIAAVEGSDHIRRALASLVRPPSPLPRRRSDAFRPRPSRLSAMSSADGRRP